MNKHVMYFPLIIVIVALIGFGMYTYRYLNSTLSFEEGSHIIGLNRSSVFVDDETGVEYLVITTDTGNSITPRYNADGTLCVKSK